MICLEKIFFASPRCHWYNRGHAAILFAIMLVATMLTVQAEKPIRIFDGKTFKGWKGI